MELVVGALVVLGFLAIFTRFGPRDSAGGFRLPHVVDGSIGMWALRRVTGRRLGAARADHEAAETDVDSTAFDPTASEPTRAALGAIAAAEASDPARRPELAAARGSVSARRQAHPARAGTTGTDFVRDFRSRRSRRRRIGAWAPSLTAGAALVAMLVVGLLAFGSSQTPRLQGDVLEATGRPASLAAGVSAQVAVVPSVTPSAGSFEPSPSASAKPTEVPDATPPPTPGPTPPPTPRPTATPGPTPTLRPTPTPPATPSPKPPTPSPKPPSPTPPLPPVAAITCSTFTLTVSCDGSNSVREVFYTFTFGDGVVVSGSDPTVSHLYLDVTALSNPVTLVVRDALGRSSPPETWSPAP